MKKVALLLSTYNGKQYLEDLLHSLIKQTYQEFIIFVRDDGSTDSTPKLIESYTKKRCNVSYIKDYLGNQGVIKSFSILLETALAHEDIDYFMFVDQDDIWLPHKIEYSVANIKKIEDNSYANLPLLFHTDLEVVDENLNILSKSFWEYQNLNPSRVKLNNLLIQNNITGCSVIINRKLAQMALPFPSESIMHDYWLGLVAATFGRIEFSNEATIRYRQHVNNSIGASKYSLSKLANKISDTEILIKKIKQAIALLEQYKSKLPQDKLHTLECFIKLQNYKRLNRLKTIKEHHFWMNGKVRNLGLLYILLKNKDL